MIRKRLTSSVVVVEDDEADAPARREEWQPRLTLVIEGERDVYRVARLLEMAGLRHGSTVYLHELGLRILRSMDKQRPGRVAELGRLLGPERVTYRGRRPPAAPAPPGHAG